MITHVDIERQLESISISFLHAEEDGDLAALDEIFDDLETIRISVYGEDLKASGTDRRQLLSIISALRAEIKAASKSIISRI